MLADDLSSETGHHVSLRQRPQRPWLPTKANQRPIGQPGVQQCPEAEAQALALATHRHAAVHHPCLHARHAPANTADVRHIPRSLTRVESWTSEHRLLSNASRLVTLPHIITPCTTRPATSRACTTANPPWQRTQAVLAAPSCPYAAWQGVQAVHGLGPATAMPKSWYP